jgi:hypothetical protein
MRSTPALLAAASAVALAAVPAVASPLPIELDPFNRASISSAIEATIIIGSEQSVDVEVNDPAVLDELRAEVVNGQLRVWRDRGLIGFAIFRDDMLKLTVTVPTLDAIAAESAADVVIIGAHGDDLAIAAESSATIVLSDLAVGSLRVDAESAADIELSGTCDKAVVRIQSSARLDAGRLKCADVDAIASSSSTARLSGSRNVEATASSSARIELVGRPTGLFADVNSSGDIDIVD